MWCNLSISNCITHKHKCFFQIASLGVNITEAIDSSPLCLLNENSPTRLPPNGTPSSPDLSLISGHLALTASWLPSISLNSDHLPINLVEDPQDSLKSQPILHNNYGRADWASYTDFTESAFSALPPPSSCSIGEKTFRNILRDASVRFIPRCSIPNYTPHFSDIAKRLTFERDRLRATDSQNPEIAILNNRIKHLGPPGRRESWPPPPRTTPLSSIPCFAHFQGRRLPWVPTSHSCLAMGASLTPPPLPELFVNSLLAAPPGAPTPPADSGVSSSGARWTTPSFSSPLSRSAKP